MPRFYLRFSVLLAATVLTNAVAAAPKIHVISFGIWTTAEWVPSAGNNKSVMLKPRALMIDGHIKEHFLGFPHEVTQRLFVVRRIVRVNDSLSEGSGAPRWQW